MKALPAFQPVSCTAPLPAESDGFTREAASLLQSSWAPSDAVSAPTKGADGASDAARRQQKPGALIKLHPRGKA